jgi:hypothetical protein
VEHQGVRDILRFRDAVKRFGKKVSMKYPVNQVLITESVIST